jgi:hypothetical protein
MDEKVILRVEGFDREIIQPLVDFFLPLNVHIECNDRSFLKSSFPIEILVEVGKFVALVGATVASEKLIYDPLIYKVSQWWDALQDLANKSGRERRISISIKFDSNDFEVSVNGSSSHKKMGHIWADVDKVVEVKRMAVSYGIAIDVIRIRYDGTDRPIVTGHTNNIISHIIDLGDKKFKPIDSSEDSNYFMVDALMERMGYLEEISSRSEADRVQQEPEIESCRQQIALLKPIFVY